jgi:hypothetical protein
MYNYSPNHYVAFLRQSCHCDIGIEWAANKKQIAVLKNTRFYSLLRTVLRYGRQQTRHHNNIYSLTFAYFCNDMPDDASRLEDFAHD